MRGCSSLFMLHLLNAVLCPEKPGGDRVSGGQVWVAGSGVVGGAGGVGGAGLCICYSVTIRLILQLQAKQREPHQSFRGCSLR